MLSINLYQLLLKKYLDFETYLIENKDSKSDKEIYETIEKFLINDEKITKYNIYKTLMDLLKKKHELSNLSDKEFVNEIIENNKSAFDEKLDFDALKNTYANYIEYDENILKDIDNYIEENCILEDYSLDYFKSPEFVNELLEREITFEHKLDWFIEESEIFNDVLEYVSDEVRNNKNYFEKIKVDKFPVLIGENLKSNEDFILKNIYKFEYKYINEKLKHNRNFILKLITKAPHLFYCLDEKFRDDKEIVLKVLEEKLKEKDNINIENKIINEIVIVVDYGFLKYVSDRLKENPEIIEKALECDIEEYEYLPKKYKNDKKIIEKVLSTKKDVAKYLENEIKNDTKYLEELYLKYDFPIVYTNNEIINKYANNKDIMKKEIYKNDEAINYISDELLKDKEYIMNVINNDKFKISYFNDNKKLLKEYKDDEEVMELLIKSNPYYINYVSNRLKKKKSFNKKIEKYLNN